MPQVTGIVNRSYSTFALALQNVNNVSSSGAFGFSSQTTRAEMQRGRAGRGIFTETGYRAHYVNTTRKSDYKHIHRHNPTLFQARNLPVGFGYDGFDGTGVGSPWMQFEPFNSMLRPSAIANRAIMLNLLFRAETDCLIKAKGMKLDLAESLVTVGQTLKMIGLRVAQVMSSYRHMRAGRFIDAAGVLGLTKGHFARRGIKGNSQLIAEGWLEIQYGWRPLLNDIFNGIEHVNRTLNQVPHVAHATRRLSEGLPFVERDVSFVWDSESLSARATASVETKFRFRVSNPDLAYLSSLGIENPAYIAWVALPMSFLVDWLIPVGDWLNALSAPLGLTFVSGYSTLRSWGTIDIVRNRLYPEHPNITVLQPAEGRVDFGFIRRVKYTSFPLPKLYFRFPFSSLERTASAVALFINGERGVRR
jgi:hypothetical protein